MMDWDDYVANVAHALTRLRGRLRSAFPSTALALRRAVTIRHQASIEH
ncbi:hypothetical protein CBM2634_P180006 [Cupriavidus taiwanensis]|uniref:Uncharacterized protein n=2 Tax=Cupriavidus taiwanensis TaxID=164546 RepID=A0A375JBR6_9BURK|nr:hypothetical protein CBM2634_P180006 [Cupriavidus taiwanensis]